mgnify:CR=1 FL=1
MIADLGPDQGAGEGFAFVWCGQLLHGYHCADDHADDDVGGGDAGFLAQEAQFRSVLPQPVHGLGLDLRALAGKIAEQPGWQDAVGALEGFGDLLPHGVELAAAVKDSAYPQAQPDHGGDDENGQHGGQHQLAPLPRHMPADQRLGQVDQQENQHAGKQRAQQVKAKDGQDACGGQEVGACADPVVRRFHSVIRLVVGLGSVAYLSGG